ncbi:WAT1-related protein At3g45870 isoform X1 [Arachis ipaensis]|uniref:WAT1-related protein At3g45870 isoform X1 n=1 Tax=Arachis ipaensis TaxID=130454 RepID=UPI0007AF664A|nr:WAT1-related protein At3g45870 isoform X1 [Arachis ipaensis]
MLQSQPPIITKKNNSLIKDQKSNNCNSISTELKAENFLYSFKNLSLGQLELMAENGLGSSVVGGGGGGETWKAQLGMLIVPMIHGGYHVITKVVLNDGVNQIVYCAYRDLIALSILAPLAYFHEKQRRPPITKGLLISFFFVGLFGVVGNHLLFVIGLSYTNPSYASALEPTVPVFTFLFSLIMGIEKVNLLRYEGVAKVVGTVICVSGAILMVVYHGPVVIGNSETGLQHVSQNASGMLIDGLKFIGLDQFSLGVICIIGHCLSMAAYLAIQAHLLKKYPTNISLTAYSYFFGAGLMVIISMFMSNEITDWILMPSEILAVLYAGIVASALAYGLITWCNKILGPIMIALFSSLQPACSTSLSLIFLGTPLYLGSILGGTFIIAGLYIVTWGSYKENQANAGVIAFESCVSDPLLQEKTVCQKAQD